MKTLFIILTFSLSVNLKAAMTGEACAALVVAEIKKENPTLSEPEAIKYWTAICNGIIDHIKAAAVISVTVPNVQTGTDTAPGTGVVSQ